MSIDPESPGPPSSASRRWFGARLRLGSRLADLLALALALGSVLAVAEMAVRPFYVPPPRRPAPQVRAAFSPNLGWALVPDPAAYSLNERAPISRHGLRGPEFTDDPEADSTAVRWLLLGGGSTFGVGVAYEDTFGSLAAAAVSADGADSVRVINAGCEGYDLNQCLRFLRTEGRFHHPDAIIVTFEPADLPGTGERDTLYTPARFAAVATRLNRAPDGRPGLAGALLRDSRLAGFLATRIGAFLQLGRRAESAAGVGPGRRGGIRLIDILNGRDVPVIESAWSTVAAEFGALRETARSLGAAVYVIVLPLAPQLSRNYPRARYQDRLAEICRRNDFVLIDPLPEMKEARRSLDRLYLPRLPFLNAAGHRIVARKLETPLADPELLRRNWRLPSQGGE